MSLLPAETVRLSDVVDAPAALDVDGLVLLSSDDVVVSPDVGKTTELDNVPLLTVIVPLDMLAKLVPANWISAIFKSRLGFR